MENPLTTIRSLNDHEIYIAAMIIGGLIVPGVLTIWIYDAALVKEIGTIKLIILGITVTSPCALVNYFVIGIAGDDSPDTEARQLIENTTTSMLMSVLLSGFFLYVMDLITFLFSISLYSFVLSYIFIDFATIAIFGYALKTGRFIK